MEVRIICAWCKRVISDPQTDRYPMEVTTSHGICPRCFEQNEVILGAMCPDNVDAEVELGGGAGHP